MNRDPVISSNVASVGYEPYTMVLEVEYIHGGVYQYFDVPEGVYREMMASESIGKFLNQHVKGSYRYVRL